ncbi:MAG: proteasome ATPase, partial [Acidimicrobiales bacterium]|nr:proteasome ATPase [Acidimicrobiales bacterium]
MGELDDQQDKRGKLLYSQIADLEAEVEELRRRVVDTPRRLTEFEKELRDTKRELARAMGQNEKLNTTLTSSRERIEALREEVDKLSEPPASYGTVVGLNDDGSADIQASGRKMRVSIHPDLAAGLTVGQEVVLNDSLSIIRSRPPEKIGEVVTVKEVLPEGLRAVVVGRADEQRVADLGDVLLREGIRSGDAALFDPRSGLLLERLPRPEVEALVLEEVPDITYADVGGLD